MLSYKIDIAYRDLITMLVIGVLHFIPSCQFPIPSCQFVSEISNACLRVFVVILQDVDCLQRFYHNIDHWGIKFYYHTISTFREAIVSEIQKCLILPY